MPKLADIDYEDIIHETPKAWLLLINGEEVWLPKSISELDIDAKTVAVPESFAIQKGLV